MSRAAVSARCSGQQNPTLPIRSRSEPDLRMVGLMVIARPLRWVFASERGFRGQPALRSLAVTVTEAGQDCCFAAGTEPLCVAG